MPRSADVDQQLHRSADFAKRRGEAMTFYVGSFFLPFTAHTFFLMERHSGCIIVCKPTENGNEDTALLQLAHDISEIMADFHVDASILVDSATPGKTLPRLSLFLPGVQTGRIRANNRPNLLETYIATVQKTLEDEPIAIPGTESCESCATEAQSGGDPKRCICQGNVNRDFSAEQATIVHLAARQWSKSKPYLRMGEVHLVRIDVPWLPRYKLVYVNGGAGDYPCSLHCLSEWTTAKVPVLQMKIEGGDEVHPHIVAQYRRHSLPAVSEQAIDPTKTTVYSSDVEYPTFCCSEPDTLPRAADAEEMAYLHAAMHATIQVLAKDGLLRSPPSSPRGNYRLFHACEGRLTIPDAEQLHPDASKYGNEVVFKYPAVDDPASRSLLETLAIIPKGGSVKDAVRKIHERTFFSGFADGKVERPIDVGDQLLLATRIKTLGNTMYLKKCYKHALLAYNAAWSLLPDDEVIQKDPWLIYVRKNILSNTVNANVHLEQWQAVVGPATRVIGALALLRNVYERRCCWARGRAYEKLGKLALAARDFEALYHFLGKHKNCEDVVKRAEVLAAYERVNSDLDDSRGAAEWTRLAAKTRAPSPRFFHLALLDATTRSLWVHGGSECEGGFTERWVGDTWCFDCATDCWRAVRKRVFACTGMYYTVAPLDVAPSFGAHHIVCWPSKVPTRGNSPQLHRHAGVIHQGKMVVFGGQCNPELPPAPLLLQLDLSTKRWMPLQLRGLHPARRFGHTCVLHDNRMWLFGGQEIFDQEAESESMNSLWSYHLESGSWCLEHNGAGFAPPSRSLHCSWVMQGFLWIFGGESDEWDDGMPRYLCDLWRFSFGTGQWEKVQTRSSCDPSCPRAETQAAAYGDKTVYLFGGYAETPRGSQYYADGLRLLVNKTGPPGWYRLRSSRAPPARAGCSLTMDVEGKRAIMFGGYNSMAPGTSGSSGKRNDTWSLRVSRRSDPTKSSPCAVCGDPSQLKCCGGSFYCGAACQRADWKQHKRVCTRRKDARKSAQGRKKPAGCSR